MNKKSIVFCGTPEAAIPCLEALMQNAMFHVTAIVTQPDRPAGRAMTLTPSPVKVCALSHALHVVQPESMNDEKERMLEHLPRPDFLVVVAYGQILSDAVLAWPSIAPINVHFSLLPRWRGASPVEAAILAGDIDTGVTIQRMEQKLDSGPILATERTMIESSETAGRLRSRLATMAAPLLVRTLIQPLDPRPQEESESSYCKILARKDGICSASEMTAEEIERRVRALQPWPGTTMEIGGKQVKIHAVSLTPTRTSIPIPCRNESILYIEMVQSPGETRLPASEWRKRQNQRMRVQSSQ